MPIYDFECPKCGRKEEELIRPGEEKNFYCEDCKVKMEREFPKSFAFKLTDNFIMGRDKPPEREIAQKIEQIKAGEIEDPYGQYRDKE